MPPERKLLHYMLINGEIVPTEDLLIWARWFEDPAERVIMQTEDKEGRRLSTVFLGLDHNFGFGGSPILFETMFFPGGKEEDNDGMWRYETLDQAKRGHAKLLKKLLSKPYIDVTPKKKQVPLAFKKAFNDVKAPFNDLASM